MMIAFIGEAIIVVRREKSAQQAPIFVDCRELLVSTICTRNPGEALTRCFQSLESGDKKFLPIVQLCIVLGDTSNLRTPSQQRPKVIA